MKRQLIKLIEYLLKKKPLWEIDDFEYQYLLWLTWLFEKSTKVPGHIVEIGVASGRNSLIFSKLISVTGENSLKKYYGFDTFEGYPLDTVNSNPGLSSKSWKSNSCTLSAVTKRLEDCGLSQFCTFIKGDCRITLKQFLNSYDDIKVNKGRMVIALLYIDCNSYEASLASIEDCWEFMPIGSLVAVDERKGGETKALIDFASRNNQNVLHDCGGIPAYCKAIVASLRNSPLSEDMNFQHLLLS